ncbi:MAG: tetratricopeptide repeat protein [Treponema sp.]|nr:tetratricopeptide repeat protein [Treponema sp.]
MILSIAARKCFAVALGIVLAAAVYAQSERPDALKLYTSGNLKEAIAVCEQEIEANPNNMDSYAVLCWSLIANRQYSEAEQRATEARKINAYDVRLIEVLGEAKYFLGKNDEALNFFQRYIANVSESASRVGRVYYYMGEIYIKQARYEHADIAFSAATYTEPLREYWWTRLGYAREMLGDWGNAILAYDRALSLNSSQYDAARGKARCQTHL